MQQLLDNPFLLLFLGVMIPMVVYLVGVIDILSIPMAQVTARSANKTPEEKNDERHPCPPRAPVVETPSRPRRRHLDRNCPGLA